MRPMGGLGSQAARRSDRADDHRAATRAPRQSRPRRAQLRRGQRHVRRERPRPALAPARAGGRRGQHAGGRAIVELSLLRIRSHQSLFREPAKVSRRRRGQPIYLMKKLLIVEDDPIIAHIYRTRLEKENYEVEIAPDGQSGFYRIQEFRPDVVLLDLMLPKMNGVEILKKIRAQPQFVKVPIIVFTNAYVPNMINESFQAGATQVFNKATLTPRQIIEAIHKALYPSAGPGTGDTPPGAPSGSGPDGSANASSKEAPFPSLAATLAGAPASGAHAGAAVLNASAAAAASHTA